MSSGSENERPSSDAPRHEHLDPVSLAPITEAKINALRGTAERCFLAIAFETRKFQLLQVMFQQNGLFRFEFLHINLLHRGTNVFLAAPISRHFCLELLKRIGKHFPPLDDAAQWLRSRIGAGIDIHHGHHQHSGRFAFPANTGKL